MNKKIWTGLLIPVFFVFSGGYAKIRLFTFQYNRADFIEIQHKCLNKFLKEKDDYELIVFNDATDPLYKEQIEQMCKKLNITCINFPQELHNSGILIENIKRLGLYGKHHNEKNGSVRHCQLVRYALDNFGYNHDDIIGIMEGDVFLIKEFSIRESLKKYDFIGAIQTDRKGKGLEYIWIGLSFFNIKKIPNPQTLNFDLNFINNTFLDSGGSTYYYLRDNPNLKLKKYYRKPITSLPRNDEQKLKQSGFTNNEIRFLKNSLDCQLKETSFLSVELHLDNHFLHYSWSRNSDGSDCKSKLFQDFFSNILS